MEAGWGGRHKSHDAGERMLHCGLGSGPQATLAARQDQAPAVVDPATRRSRGATAGRRTPKGTLASGFATP